MSLAYHSTEYLENQIETFKILLGKKDVDIASLRAQNELTHAAYVEENNRLMAEREALRFELAEAQGSAKLNGLMCDLGFANLDTWRDETLRLRAELAAAKRELNDAEEARNDAETRLLASLAVARHDAEALSREQSASKIWEQAYQNEVVGVSRIRRQDAEEKARLTSVLKNVTSILEDAQSGHIPGCGGDTEWIRSRDMAVNDARAALACRPQPARNRPLPETRCDCCDNGLDDAWEFCPFCGQQHPDAAGALDQRNET